MSYSIFLEKLFDDMKLKAKTLKPHQSYTAYLNSLNSEAVSKKLMEEAFELSLANMNFANKDNLDYQSNNNQKSEIINEAADVIYHLMALIVTKDVDFKQVVKKLEERGTKKLDEINFQKNDQ